LREPASSDNRANRLSAVEEWHTIWHCDFCWGGFCGGCIYRYWYSVCAGRHSRGPCATGPRRDCGGLWAGSGGSRVMLLFLESFANWDTLATGALGKWTTISNGASVLSIGATASRTGGPAAVFYAASPVSNYTLQSYLAKTLASGQTTLT